MTYFTFFTLKTSGTSTFLSHFQDFRNSQFKSSDSNKTHTGTLKVSLPVHISFQKTLCKTFGTQSSTGTLTLKSSDLWFAYRNSLCYFHTFMVGMKFGKTQMTATCWLNMQRNKINTGGFNHVEQRCSWRCLTCCPKRCPDIKIDKLKKNVITWLCYISVENVPKVVITWYSYCYNNIEECLGKCTNISVVTSVKKMLYRML